LACITTPTSLNGFRDVCDDFNKKEKRADNDHEAFLAFNKNHPRPTHNYRGEPQWDGSDAQRLLKEDVVAGVHLNYSTPSELRLSRPEYQVYGVDVFRAHLHQEKRLRKYYNFCDQDRAQKLEMRKEDFKKQQKKAQAAATAKAAKEGRKARDLRAAAAQAAPGN
jgi:hypothetical protein